MSAGTGVGSVQTPFSWCFGFVTKPVPPTQLVEPGSVPRQYCVCTPAQGLPPMSAKNEFDVVLERLAREELPVGVGGLEAGRPLGAPVDEIDGGLGLDADRAGAGVAAVVDQVVRGRVGDRSRRVLAGRPEEVLRVGQAADVGGCGGRRPEAPTSTNAADKASSELSGDLICFPPCEVADRSRGRVV